MPDGRWVTVENGAAIRAAKKAHLEEAIELARRIDSQGVNRATNNEIGRLARLVLILLDGAPGV